MLAAPMSGSTDDDKDISDGNGKVGQLEDFLLEMNVGQLTDDTTPEANHKVMVSTAKDLIFIDAESVTK